MYLNFSKSFDGKCIIPTYFFRAVHYLSPLHNDFVLFIKSSKLLCHPWDIEAKALLLHHPLLITLAKYNLASLWNSISDDTKNAASVKACKSNYKLVLQSQYDTTCQKINCQSCKNTYKNMMPQ